MCTGGLHGPRGGTRLLTSVPGAPTFSPTTTNIPLVRHLSPLTRHQEACSPPTHRRVSADSTGDYLTHVLDPATGIARQTIYGTLFATRRVAPYTAPSVDLMVGRGSVPAQPAPVPLEPQTVFGSVLGYLGRGVTTGAEIDALRTCALSRW